MASIRFTRCGQCGNHVRGAQSTRSSDTLCHACLREVEEIAEGRRWREQTTVTREALRDEYLGVHRRHELTTDREVQGCNVNGRGLSLIEPMNRLDTQISRRISKTRPHSSLRDFLPEETPIITPIPIKRKRDK